MTPANRVLELWRSTGNLIMWTDQTKARILISLEGVVWRQVDWGIKGGILDQLKREGERTG